MAALARRVVGDSGPVVVLLHGLLGRGRNLATAASALAGSGYRAVMLDLPNHGRSPWTDSLTLPDLAQAVADEVAGDDLGAGAPVHLVGHSLGGKAVMQLALRRPEVCASLVVVDIAPVDYGGVSASEFSGYLQVMRELRLGSLASRADADEIVAASVPDDRVRGFLLQNLARTRDGWSWDANLDVLEEGLEEVSGFPLDGTAPYDGPVLFVAGQDSGYVRDDYRDTMTELFPRSRVVKVKGAGHWVHSEQPELFAELLLRHLQALR